MMLLQLLLVVITILSTFSDSLTRYNCPASCLAITLSRTRFISFVGNYGTRFLQRDERFAHLYNAI